MVCSNWVCGLTLILFPAVGDESFLYELRKELLSKAWKLRLSPSACLNLKCFCSSVSGDDRLGAAAPPRLLFPWPVEHSGLHRGQRRSGGLRLLVSLSPIRFLITAFDVIQRWMPRHVETAVQQSQRLIRQWRGAAPVSQSNEFIQLFSTNSGASAWPGGIQATRLFKSRVSLFEVSTAPPSQSALQPGWCV